MNLQAEEIAIVEAGREVSAINAKKQDNQQLLGYLDNNKGCCSQIYIWSSS